MPFLRISPKLPFLAACQTDTLSAKMGCRAVDIGQVQLSLHSIRATTGALDVGLGIKLWKGFFDFYEEVDQAFQ